MKFIDIHELFERSKKVEKDELILDVRTPKEFEEGHIEGSLNIPHDHVSQHLERLRDFRQIIVHCKKGGRAMTACRELQAAGLENLVCVAEDGMDAWSEAGYPCVKGK